MKRWGYYFIQHKIAVARAIMATTETQWQVRRHRKGKVTLATVKAAMETLSPGASMRAIRSVTGGSFRDVCAVVNLVRRSPSFSIQEAFVEGAPNEFVRALIDSLRAIEQLVSETRSIQECHEGKLAELKMAVEGWSRPNDDCSLDALVSARRESDSIAPDLLETAAKDQTVISILLAGFEARILEGIAKARIAIPLPKSETELLQSLQASQAGILSSLAQIQNVQRQLADSVAALQRFFVDGHAMHQLTESDESHKSDGSST
jgi:hypothetical protein